MMKPETLTVSVLGAVDGKSSVLATKKIQVNKVIGPTGVSWATLQYEEIFIEATRRTTIAKITCTVPRELARAANGLGLKRDVLSLNERDLPVTLDPGGTVTIGLPDSLVRFG